MKLRKPIPVFGYVNGYAARIYGHSLKEHTTNIPASIRAQLLAKALHGYEGNPSYGWADGAGWHKRSGFLRAVFEEVWFPTSTMWRSFAWP